MAVYLRQLATQGPVAQASSGMYAAGDAMLGVAVFGMLFLVPLALALYWLRPVPRFWLGLQGAAILFALTGWLTVALFLADPGAQSLWMILALVRFALMPLTALALLLCTVFAPQKRQRWLLLGAAITDGGIFAGVVIVHFVLPTLARA